MIGHVFRRPQASVTGTGSGSLAAGTYYVQVTTVDVAGRESAPSPEISQTVGASSSINLSATTAIYFPAGCNFYFGASPGTEGNYFASTSVTNGTCTYTLTSTSGETAKTPMPVGNAMRSWLTEENNANSCLFCGSGGGLGSGFLGFNLTTLQYSVPPTGVQFPFNGGVHSYKFYSASETSSPTGVANVDSCMPIRPRTAGKKSKTTAPRKRWEAPIVPRALTRAPLRRSREQGRRHLFYVHHSGRRDGRGAGSHPYCPGQAHDGHRVRYVYAFVWRHIHDECGAVRRGKSDRTPYVSHHE